VHAFQLRELDAALQQIPAGVDRDYVAGILAVRSGRPETAISLLARALPGLRDAQPQRAVQALKALADANMLLYRYPQAADAFNDLEQHFAGQPDSDVTSDAALARILVNAPPQTIAWDGPVQLEARQNPIRSRVAKLDAHGIREEWLLDTGANQSVVSRSFAARLGLTPLSGTALVGSGVTGLKSPLRAAILPELRVGGATLRNVVVMILDDENLRIGPASGGYQLHAILGFPALKALGSISFTRSGAFLASPATNTVSGVPIFMRGLTPAIECDVEGEPLLFTFDTGASSTDLSVRYYEKFRGQNRLWRTREVESGGGGGSIKRTMFIQPAVTLKVAGSVVTLPDVSIFSTRMNAGIDVLFGNLGQDFVEGFERVTLDFVHMRFSPEPLRAER